MITELGKEHWRGIWVISIISLQNVERFEDCGLWIVDLWFWLLTWKQSIPWKI